eukprot:COSAG04_NODE_14291_length_574_cov_0.520000_1_plen_87_part_10
MDDPALQRPLRAAQRAQRRAHALQAEVDDAAPAVSVITSVALDHSDLLGDTLPAIAREKAGIVKRGCPAVIGPLHPSPTAEIAAWAE